MVPKAIVPLKIDCPVFIITDANMEAMAIVEEKSKADILANVRRPEILVIRMMMLKIKSTEKKTVVKVDQES